MKLIYSLFMLATLGMLMNNISESKRALFTLREMREVDRRLNAIGAL